MTRVDRQEWDKWLMDCRTGLLWYGLILDVHDYYIKTMGWWISYWYRFSIDRWDLTYSRWGCIVRNQCRDLLLVLIHVIESYWKILSDRNTCIVPLFYRLHKNIIHIVIITSLILLLSPYRPSNQNNIDINLYK